MDVTEARKVLAKYEAHKALFVSDEDTFAALDAFIDAGDMVSVGRLRIAAGLWEGAKG